MESWWCYQIKTFSVLLAVFRGIHRSSVDSPHKSQRRGALIFLCSAPEQTAEQTIETPGFETPSRSLWRNCNANVEHFWNVAINPFDAGLVFPSSGSVVVRNRTENVWTDFHEIFNTCRTWHKTQLAKRFHTWLDCFTVLKLGVAACPLATLCKIDESIFIKFSGLVGYHTRNNKEHFGGVMFNPLDAGFACLSSGSVLVDIITGKLGNGFSWNFQDIDARNNWPDGFTTD